MGQPVYFPKKITIFAIVATQQLAYTFKSVRKTFLKAIYSLFISYPK